MTVFAFVGPTIPTDVVHQAVDCVCLGPAAQGDVYRASLRHPDAIAIVDGYFEHVCAVWHKEILWALHHGIPVYGSSSMGALRAAELDTFGMIGVGAVYESFRDGVLEDDDEVAVLHGPPESRYAPVTEAMVNIRATLARASEAGVLSPSTAAALVTHAKSLHYGERRYEKILSDGSFRPGEREKLVAWLPSGRVDQKRNDAITLFAQLADDLAAGLPRPPAFPFEYTTLFDDLRRTAGELDLGTAGDRLFGDAVLDEVRLAGEWPELRLRAIVRHLALEDARRQRFEPSDDELVQAVLELRSERGLVEPDELAAWLLVNNLAGADFLRLVADEAAVGRALRALDGEIGTSALDLLRLEGRYAALADRAREKKAAFAAVDADPPDASLYEEARGLVRRERSTQTAIRELGFATAEAFDRAAIGELFYVRADLR